MLKRFTGILAVIIALIFMLTACGGRNEGIPSGESGYTDEQLLVGSVNRFAGVVVSGKETKIEKESGKKVKSVKVSVGDVVKKGDVLFTYDSSDAQYDYDKAELELDQMRMSLENYNSQRAELEKEKASAPASEQLSYTIQIQELDTTIRETEYNIGLKEKDLEKMKDGLGDLKVYSPVDGKIQSINNTETESGSDDNDNNDNSGENDLLGGNSFSGTSSDSQPFMVIAQANAFRIKAYINEENISSLTTGDPVTVRSRVDDNTWEGEVAEVETGNPQQDQGGYYDGDNSEVTSSSKYPFFVNLKSSDGLILGQHVYVEIYMETYELPEGDTKDAEDANQGFDEESSDEGGFVPAGDGNKIEGED